MTHDNKKIIYFTLSLVIFLIACQEKPQQNVKQNPAQPKASEPKLAQKTVEIPTTVQAHILVNNSVPLPLGYQIDTTHLIQPKLIDFNGDGKLDAFRVLKNPNKTDMKYLFEFRIADSEKVYFYEDENGDDLHFFGTFEIAPKTEIYTDEQHRFDKNGNIRPNKTIDPKYYLKFKGDGISANVVEETCATSVFFLQNEKIRRIHLC